MAIETPMFSLEGFHPLLPDIQANISTALIPVDVFHPFPEAMEPFAQNLLVQTGMPLTHVNTLAYIPNTYGTHGVLGSAEIAGENDGRLTFYKDMDKIPAIGQVGVAVHELAHFSSPFAERTNDDFGGEEKRLRAQDTVIRVANQSAETGIFLNSYHEFIYNIKDRIRPEDQEAWEQLWLEETHAIASELAATNPRHLEQIDNAHYARLKSAGKEDAFVPLVSRRDRETNETLISGIDQTLMDLTGITNIDALYTHWEHLRETYRGMTTPFHKTHREPVGVFPVIPERKVVIIVGYRRRSGFGIDPEDLIETII